MLKSKYLNPRNYLQKIKLAATKLCFTCGLSITVKIKIDNYRITFITRSEVEYKLRAQESYRREEVTMYWLRNLIRPGDVVYDIGANVGAYSLYAGYKLRCSSGTVYAFEPAYQNFDSLCRNIALNSLSGVVIPYPIPIANDTMIGKFYMSSQEPGSALHGLNYPHSEGKKFQPKYVQGTLSISLDEFALSTDIRFPNHIKIDVDGSEGDIIGGMESILSDTRLRSIMIEVDSDLSRGLIEQTIEKSGFSEERVEKWSGKSTYNKLYCR